MISKKLLLGRERDREKLDFLIVCMEFYKIIWCYMVDLCKEEKKFIHFDINLLILDHSWLNEINIHRTVLLVGQSLASLRIKSINLEKSE